MGRAQISGPSFRNYMHNVRQIYEPQLEALGLGESQIERQAIQELRESLDRINEAIAKPEQFGVFGIKITPEAGVLIARSATEGNITVGALPFLLQRKKLILERIRILAPEEQLSDVSEVLEEKVEDPAVREQLKSMLAEYAAEQRTLAEEAQESGKEAFNAALVDIEIRERKWRMRRSFIEREPIAILVGAVILLVVTIALVTAMFTGVESPEILVNAFLIILGYFFGQSAAAGRQEGQAHQSPETPSR